MRFIRKRVLPLLLLAALLMLLCACAELKEQAAAKIKETVDQAVTSALNSALENGNLQELLKDTPFSQLLEEGVTIQDLLGEGVSISDLLGEGVSVTDLLSGGVDPESLLENGVSPELLERLGVSEEELADYLAGDTELGTVPEGFVTVSEDGWYTSLEDVSAYLFLYGTLPGNFITKEQAKEKFDWEGGGLPDGYCIGGDHFGNYEGLLPEGFDYTECDIDTMNAASRGAKRLVFTVSEEGLRIYYTEDHYESFTEILREEP